MSNTKKAYLAVRCLDIPIWAIFNMLPLILIKDLHASPYYLSLFIAIKPFVSVVSIYWSSLVKGRPDRLRSNIIIAKVLSVFPFFFFPLFPYPTFIIISAAIFMSLTVGVVPAWMEVLKKRLHKKESGRLFAWGSSIGYLGGGILPLFFGSLLDDFPHIWRWIFPAAASFSLIALYYILKIKDFEKEEFKAKDGWKEGLLKPWTSACNVLLKKPDFAKYQIAFMVIGSGLMLMQPALYIYFETELNLSYVHFAVALSLCKGASYALTSPLWAKWLSQTDIFRFSGTVTALACFFPMLLLVSSSHIYWLYMAYIIYGVAQAGNELSWNMAGPIFAGKEDSSPYTSVNVFFVGIRGMIIPFLGTLLCSLFGPVNMFLVSALTLLASTFLFIYYSNKQPILAENKKGYEPEF